MTIGAGDVDPADQVHIRFVFVPVLDGNHSSAEQSYYFIQVTNITQSTILYTNFGPGRRAGLVHRFGERSETRRNGWIGAPCRTRPRSRRAVRESRRELETAGQSHSRSEWRALQDSNLRPPGS